MDKDMKKGQIAIWVILAIVIVATIGILLFLTRVVIVPKGNLNEEQNPNNIIDKCVKSSVQEAVDIMLPQGGFLNATNYKLYKDDKVSYLCSSVANYISCVNQHPMFLNDLKSEILKYIRPKIENCFGDLKASLTGEGYVVSVGAMNLAIDLGPNKVLVNIERNVKIVKNVEVQNFEDFSSEVTSPLYDLAIIAADIANGEAKFCTYDYVAHMNYYPRFDIRKVSLGDSTKIYTIMDRQSDKTLAIAIRGCAIPAGY